MRNLHRPDISPFVNSSNRSPKSKIQNPKSRPNHILLVLLLVSSTLAGGCSLSNLPTAKRTPTAGSAQVSQPSPTATALSDAAQLEARLTPLLGGSASGSQSAAKATATFAPPQSAPPQGGAWQVPAEQQAVVKVVEQVSPAVVTVVNKLEGTQGGFEGEARGSGVIVDNDGHIITNYHVVEGATEGGLTVIFTNGDSIAARLVGTDNISDLAVLKVDPKVSSIAPLGHSDALKVGETVIAIGSALGDFRNTVTVGVISGLNRTLTGENGVNMTDMIQTDAAINHGNSGGPLLNLSGEVVGINTAVVRGTGSTGLDSSGDIAEGLGFAIPVDTVRSISAQLIRTGKVPRPYLGVETRAISPMLASYYDLRDDKGALLDHGVIVRSVFQDSAADKAGLVQGDVILSIKGSDIDEDHPLVSVLMNFQPGDQVELSVIRNGRTIAVKVTLGTRP